MIKFKEINVDQYSWTNLEYYEDDINGIIKDMKNQGYMFQELKVFPPFAYNETNVDYSQVPAQDMSVVHIQNGKILLIFKATDLKASLQGE